MNAKKLLKQVTDLRELANQDLSEWDPRTRPSKEIAKAQAAVELVAAETEYGVYLSEAAAALVLDGPNQGTFAQIAAQEGESLTLDAGALYARLATAIEPSMGKRRDFGVTQYRLMVQELSSISNELNVKSLEIPKYCPDFVCPTEADVASVCQTHIFGVLDSQLNRLYLRHAFFAQAVAAGVTKPVVPVVILNTPSSEQEGLVRELFKRGLSVQTTEEVTTPTVLKVFTQLKKLVNKKGSEENNG